MPKIRSRRGFTWIELVVIIILCGVLLGLLLPAIQSARERSRRNECCNNLKLIGLGMHNFHDTHRFFPNSAALLGDGPKKTAGGWSFLFKILPDLGYDKEHKTISQALRNDVAIDPLTNPDPALIKLRNQSFREFLCPTNPNKVYENSANKTNAFTNYKAMGATCMESLMLCVDPDSPPPYGDAKHHPDGGLFPGNKGIRLGDIADGTSHTILMAETIDDSKSAWIAGSDVTLVGMPKAKYYKKPDTGQSFIAPLDYNGSYYDHGGVAIQAMRTYLSYDFSPRGKEAGTYPAGVGRTPVYGPSSNHAGIVNHLYGDGSVRGVRKDVDYAVYFFEITRDANDPASCGDPDWL